MNRNRQSGNKRKKKGGGSFAALFLLFLVLLAVAGYFFTRSLQLTKKSIPPSYSQITSAKIPSLPPTDKAPKTETTAPIEKVPQKVAPYPTRTEPVEPIPEKKITGTGRLAVIIDDMGTKVEEAKAISDIGVPLTFSIIPGLRSFREVASFAATKNIEVMIHIPMQSKGWPQRRLEVNGLLLSMDDTSVTDRIKEYIREIPSAIGANNHMGSEYTENEGKMRVVLEVLKQNRLYFIDSVTTPKTTGLKVAREIGIRSERRNVFLDNEQNPAYIKGQLDQAVRIARNRGFAIAICHPHPATIKTLAELLPGLAKQGITLVPVSKLVK